VFLNPAALKQNPFQVESYNEWICKWIKSWIGGWAEMIDGLKERMKECLESSVYTIQIKRYNSMILHLTCVYNIFIWILLIFSGLVTGMQNFRKGKMCIVDWFAGRKCEGNSWHNYSLHLKKYVYDGFLLQKCNFKFLR
jgi:hypothetical protein